MSCCFSVGVEAVRLVFFSMSATASTIEYELVEEEEMDEANSEASYASLHSSPPPLGDDSQPESSPPRSPPPERGEGGGRGRRRRRGRRPAPYPPRERTGGGRYVCYNFIWFKFSLCACMCL